MQSKRFSPNLLRPHRLRFEPLEERRMLSVVNMDIFDDNLEAVIRTQLGKPAPEDITDDDLADITSLFADGKGITHLQGMEYCTGVETLDLDNNLIDDISPLAGLTSLIDLELADNQISDISPLADKTSLMNLFLDSNRIDDLAAVENMSNLVFLRVEDNLVTDLAPVVACDGFNLPTEFSGFVYLTGNPLSTNAVDVQIPALEDRNVKVFYIPLSQIIDDGDAGFNTSGNWYSYSSLGFEDDLHYSFAGTGSDTASWSFTVTPGQYQVAATWAAHANRATNAPYEVYNGATSLGTVRANQQVAPDDFTDQGAVWESLGIFTITGDTLMVELSDSANGLLIADAVRVERVIPQIIDNGDAGFTTSGSWYPYSSLGFEDDLHYSFAGSGSDTASWSFTVTPGQYEVATTWATHTNRATNAPYTIYDGATSLETVQVNQQAAPDDFTDQGVAWETLGTFTLTGSTLLVKLSDNANGLLIADAVRIERVGDVPPIIDNGDAGFTTSGNWYPYSSLGFEGDLHYSFAGTGSDVASWSFTVTPGKYEVAATWAEHPNRAANAPYTVYNGATSLDTVPVNQQAAPDDFTDQGAAWETLGIFNITVDTLSVKLSDNADGLLIADAIRIERVGDLPPIIDNGDTGFSASGNWYPYAGLGFEDDLHYSFAGDGSDVASWSFTVTPGQYQVAATWAEHPNRASNAPYEVYDGVTSLDTVLVNQQAAPDDFSYQGAGWKSLGIFTITGGMLVVELSDSANGLLIADAVRIDKVVSPSSIIDNGDTGFNTSGNWYPYSSLGFGDDLHYSFAGSGSDVASWNFTVTPGEYEVAATWAEHPNRATNAPYEVFNGATSLETVPVDQQAAPDDFTDQGTAWETLGTYTITGDTLRVELSDAANGLLIADAVRIERVGSPLLAAGGEVSPAGELAALTGADLQPIVTDAIADWAGAGLATEQLEALLAVEFIVTDLPGALLGLATTDAIYLDINAAGHSWFIDPTPGVNEEFQRTGGELRALDPQAVDRMDLLTVVSHELGHALGLEDLGSSSGSLMSGTLETGLRREPGVTELDALFARL